MALRISSIVDVTETECWARMDRAARLAAIKAWLAQGASWRVIADTLGTTVSVVSTFARRNGIERKGGRGPGDRARPKMVKTRGKPKLADVSLLSDM